MINRIDRKFSELKKQRKAAFIAFITAGDPSLSVTEKLVRGFEAAGVDIVELGVPFSDPLADGPTIQAASQRALSRGVTVAKILSLVKRIRKTSQIPLCLMTYYNPVFHFGEERFVREAASAGVDGLIIPDLPVAEAANLIRHARKCGLATIFFISPTTKKDRLGAIDRASRGFIYYVSVSGVTGERKELPAELLKDLKIVRRKVTKPLCVGFGISTGAQVAQLSRVADGVIVGSAIVQEILRHRGKKELIKKVSAFVRNLTTETFYVRSYPSR